MDWFELVDVIIAILALIIAAIEFDRSLRARRERKRKESYSIELCNMAKNIESTIETFSTANEKYIEITAEYPDKFQEIFKGNLLKNYELSEEEKRNQYLDAQELAQDYFEKN
ncbi:MAG: hypothetical protein ACOYIK_09575 [Coriobacteriales bacterium]|jgi:hypothetical protein